MIDALTDIGTVPLNQMLVLLSWFMAWGIGVIVGRVR